MANILINNEDYEEYAFENEVEFEKAVIENSKFLFGADTIYVDLKKRVGDSNSHNKGIPDGFLIDFSDRNKPKVYFIENELSKHDILGHISEQLLRFNAMAKVSKTQIRDLLLIEIRKNKELSNKIKEIIKESRFHSIEGLLIDITEKNNVGIILVIDDLVDDLQDLLTGLNPIPDSVILKRYIKDKKVAYYYEPLTQAVGEIQKSNYSKKGATNEEYDTIVCAAFEEGFQKAYVLGNAWWAIRISQAARERLRYLAIYKKSPVMAIEDVAEIDRIEPFEDSGKFIVYLKNKKKISPIKYDKPGSAPQSPRFTTLKRLNSSKVLSDLWKY